MPTGEAVVALNDTDELGATTSALNAFAGLAVVTENEADTGTLAVKALVGASVMTLNAQPVPTPAP